MTITRYVVELDDEDRGPDDTGRPWNAALLLLEPDGRKTGDVIGVGLGATPRAALIDLANSGDFVWTGGDQQ